MNKLFLTALSVILFKSTLLFSEPVLEPYTYSENFQAGEENSWASYPLWQDTAYDPNFRIGMIVPGDSNLSVDQTVQPYSHVDNYAGAQKLLDIYLQEDSSLSLRFYIKSHLPAEYFKIQLAAGPDGKIEYTVPSPSINKWVTVSVGYYDLATQNPVMKDKSIIKIYAIAGLAKISEADSTMPFHFGLDDIVVKGAIPVQFRFNEPKMFKLSEWKYYFPLKHYKSGELFNLNGKWPIDADTVKMTVVSFTDTTKNIFETALVNKNGEWSIKPLKLNFSNGMYLAKLYAFRKKQQLSECGFTFVIAPDNLAGKHPRVLFDKDKLEEVKLKLKSPKYAPVLNDILEKAKKYRTENPLETTIYDYDQFNDIDLTVDMETWLGRFQTMGYGIEYNAYEYAFTGNKDAADYAIGLLLKQADFPTFNHPWMEKRGRYMYWQGQQADNFAIGYDILFDLMNENERQKVREGIQRNFVNGSFRTFVEDNAITTSTSNWIPHMAGNPLICVLSMYGDNAMEIPPEPYFTGLIYKVYDHISKAVLPEGAYCEGWGYYGVSMIVWGQLLPVLERNFNIDLSTKLNGSYKEAVWAGYLKNKRTFYFGDSNPNLGPIYDFAYILTKHNDPLLGWLYNFLKGNETLNDVLYDTENVPKKDPSDENPVKLFRELGTTVFKSGWEKDDFVFVFRSGPFFNHQHSDQGTFWLADYGSIFIEERHGDTYDNTPLYRPLYTKPYAHSTILINGNKQSQRVGDPRDFAPGFDDHAFITHFLDGSFASFVSGDIGKLYWGKVKDIKRNVLYLKPRAVLMLDTILPSEKDSDVTLLYQTAYLKDIKADNKASTITKDGNILNIMHLFPTDIDVKAVETPHYYFTLRGTKPLVKEGMLTVSKHTSGEPLIMANLLTTTKGEAPQVKYEHRKGCIAGNYEGTDFAFPEKLGAVYEFNGITTDALAISSKGDTIFAAICKSIKKGDISIFESDEPLTCEITSNQVKYYVSGKTEIKISSKSIPEKIELNGKEIKNYLYDSNSRIITLNLNEGEGILTF